MFWWTKLDKILAMQGYFSYFRWEKKSETMSHLLCFAGSNASTSINYQLVRHTAAKTGYEAVRLLDMFHYPFPLYSEDYEKENGYSNALVEFKEEIKSATGIIIAVNEHNGNPSAYFKNLIDWLSRVDIDFIRGKKVFLMATSPGGRGAQSSLELAKNLLIRFGAVVTDTYSLPLFAQNFNIEKGITQPELAEEHQQKLDTFIAAIQA